MNTQNLKGFGIENLKKGIIAAGVVLNYLKETQKNNIKQITNISLFTSNEFMALDASTRKNLEISFSKDSSNFSLLNVIDETETSMGGRLLRKWITAPLRNLNKIIKRKTLLKLIFQ